jgi:trk system potassium uptake protein TrkA
VATLRIAVIGLGYLGTTLVRELADADAEVLAIDSDPDLVEQVRDIATIPVQMDSTDERALRAQNLDKVDAVVVTIGHDFESLIVTVQELLLMGVSRIYARATTPSHQRILQRMGVTGVISPEEDAGRRLAQRLMNPGLVDYLDVSGDYRIVEIECPPKFQNKSIGALGLRRLYSINLVTLRRTGPNGEFTVVGVPTPDMVLSRQDMLVILGRPKDIQRLIQQNQ